MAGQRLSQHDRSVSRGGVNLKHILRQFNTDNSNRRFAFVLRDDNAMISGIATPHSKAGIHPILRLWPQRAMIRSSACHKRQADPVPAEPEDTAVAEAASLTVAWPLFLRSGNLDEIRIASPKNVPGEYCRCLTRMPHGLLRSCPRTWCKVTEVAKPLASAPSIAL